METQQKPQEQVESNEQVQQVSHTVHTPEQIADRKKIFEQEFKPLQEQLYHLSEKHGFPIIIGTQIAADVDGFFMVTTANIEKGVACLDMFNAAHILENEMPRHVIASRILEGNRPT